MNILTTDILIIGGGIAGLWMMNILSKKGYSVILCEKDTLGGGQTIKSQGIIHGGLKYSLSGIENLVSHSLSDMPSRWHKCLSGNGELDLHSVKVLSNNQYMWSINKLTGSLATFLAKKALKSDINLLSNYPPIFKNSKINSKLYGLSEKVLDIPSLIYVLAKPYLEQCLKIRYNDNLSIKAQKYIYTAGSGNISDKMQLRPLHMVMVKSTELEPLYGHCLGIGTTPRLTITTHRSKDGNLVWYLGGKIAETGVKIDSKQQIKKAQKEINHIFPTINLKNAKWASFFVNRAEAKQRNKKIPNSISIFNNDNHIIAWPTKLTLTPILGDRICALMKDIKPKYPLPDVSKFPKAKISIPIWDQLL